MPTRGQEATVATTITETESLKQAAKTQDSFF